MEWLFEIPANDIDPEPPYLSKLPTKIYGPRKVSKIERHNNMMVDANENNGAAAAEYEASQESVSKLAADRPNGHSSQNNNEPEESSGAAAVTSLPPPATAANTTTTTTTTASTTTATTTATAIKTKDDNNESSSFSFIPQIAKDRLSKWAARLFDPNRPKGVIQPPQTIPLNDEFLKAFGKREQAMDAMTGKSLTIDRTIPDDDDDYDDNATNGDATKKDDSTAAVTITETDEPLAGDTNLPNNETATTTFSSRNVKISNLRFTTTNSELESLCQRFGEIEKTTVIKNPVDETKNLGIAYVLFTSSDAAARCLAELHNVQNRPVTVVEAKPPGEKKNSAGGLKRKASRYWESDDPDLSLKCYHCGLYGHMASACQNAKLLKPCTLCGVTSHDARNCDKKVFCFTCGLPGHSSRDCPEPQPIRRLICTICYGADHHKSQCRNFPVGGEPFGVSPHVVCMVCGQLGHFSCRRISVFYGLRGVCCCNWYVALLRVPFCFHLFFFRSHHIFFRCSGALGHTINNCRAPNLAMCDRNQDTPPIMLDGGWTAAQVQNAIVQMNAAGQQQQVVVPPPPPDAARGWRPRPAPERQQYNNNHNSDPKRRRMR
jgi:RNA recognition motif. (a.k.a. RRM, RBD, or RNP domain)/Zinc knuckle